MECLDGKRILVTGGAGFIGSHLCDSLLKEPIASLVAADNLFLGSERNLTSAVSDQRFEFVKVDVTDFDLVSDLINKFKIDTIFHLAIIPLEASLEKPVWCFDENVRMTQAVLEGIRKGPRPIKLVAYSSSEVYGTALYTPMDEEHPLMTHTPYAASKAASDLLVISYQKTFGLEASILRPFNNFGPRQNEGSYAGVIPVTMKRILNGEPPVIYDDGQQTRDFIYVTDSADWTVRFFEKTPMQGEIVNLASGRQTTVQTVIDTICDELHYDGRIEHREKRPGDVRSHEGAVEKARELMGFKPTVSFKEGIARTVEWYLKEVKELATGEIR